MPIPPPGFFDDDPRTESPEPGFEILGDFQFSPTYLPKTIRVTKERNLNRKESFCKGEDVTDTGAKNRDIHVAGKLVGGEKDRLNILADSDEVYTLSCPAWTGDVRVSKAEYEGPVAHDSKTGKFVYEFSMDLVSTGRDEGALDNGIIESPSRDQDVSCTYKGRPRTDYKYTGSEVEDFRKWQNCEINTEIFVAYTAEGNGIASVELKDDV